MNYIYDSNSEQTKIQKKFDGGAETQNSSHMDTVFHRTNKK